jgi:hypothetical protein
MAKISLGLFGRLFSVLLLGFGTLLYFTQPAIVLAQANTGMIQIVPTFQEVVINAATEATTSAITITNNSDSNQEFEISPIDIRQFDDDGRIALADKPLTGEKYALASFITVGSNSISVPSKSSITVPLTITNTPSLSPGGHYAAIVVRLIDTSKNNQIVLPAVSSFMLVRKEGGEQYHLSLQKTDILDTYGLNIPDQTSLHFSNQGNTHVIPRGNIVFKDIFKHIVSKSTINENSLYVFPGTERILNQPLTKITSYWPVSLLFVEINGSSQPGDIPFSQSGWYVSFNPVSLAALVALMIGIIFIAMRKKYINKFDKKIDEKK